MAVLGLGGLKYKRVEKGSLKLQNYIDVTAEIDIPVQLI